MTYNNGFFNETWITFYAKRVYQLMFCHSSRETWKKSIFQWEMTLSLR